jgi:hypothetical protein
LNPWGYKKYLDSVRCDMKVGQEQMGFNQLQSFGYAHNELVMRLEEFPNENPLALVGLAACLAESGGFNELSSDEGFILELKDNLKMQCIEDAVKHLDQEDTRQFMADLEKVKSLLNW